jgi:hypothetical protein
VTTAGRLAHDDLRAHHLHPRPLLRGRRDGYLHHSRYLQYFEIGRVELLRAEGTKLNRSRHGGDEKFNWRPVTPINVRKTVRVANAIGTTCSLKNAGSSPARPAKPVHETLAGHALSEAADVAPPNHLARTPCPAMAGPMTAIVVLAACQPSKGKARLLRARAGLGREAMRVPVKGLILLGEEGRD